MPHRRRTDLVASDRRRSPVDRRRIGGAFPIGARCPSLQEQAVQFLTRYLFVILGLVFFNYAVDSVPRWMPLWQINALLGIHLVINTVNFFHAWLKPVSLERFRFALWVDIIGVTVCVANDPYDIPPSLVAYIVVALGNGMRYGMPFFAEAVCGCLVAGVVAMAARYAHLPNAVSPGTAFLSLFGAIIVIYAYLLMNRVERARHRSEQVSRTDALTGLLNRRGLNEAAEGWLCAAASSEHPLVVMFADLDNFKMVNDTKGHAEGDRVLVQIATTLRASLRAGDLVARYGGDEFVLLLSGITLGEGEHIARRIQTAVGDWFVDNGLSCGISIGFTAVPPAELDLAKVLTTVDHLLYRSKAERAGNGIRQVELSDYSVT